MIDYNKTSDLLQTYWDFSLEAFNEQERFCENVPFKERFAMLKMPRQTGTTTFILNKLIKPEYKDDILIFTCNNASLYISSAVERGYNKDFVVNKVFQFGGEGVFLGDLSHEETIENLQGKIIVVDHYAWVPTHRQEIIQELITKNKDVLKGVVLL